MSRFSRQPFATFLWFVDITRPHESPPFFRYVLAVMEFGVWSNKVLTIDWWGLSFILRISILDVDVTNILYLRWCDHSRAFRQAKISRYSSIGLWKQGGSGIWFCGSTNSKLPSIITSEVTVALLLDLLEHCGLEFVGFFWGLLKRRYAGLEQVNRL
jgi:hypothetical protein